MSDNNEQRIAAHRALHNIGLPPHPDTEYHINLLRGIEPLQRLKLIDLGWTPPKHPVDQPQVPVKAYLHRTSDDCVTTDPTAYENPRCLVLSDDVVDHIDWLEHGIDEWRAYAVEAGKQLKAARDQRAELVAALESFLRAPSVGSNGPGSITIVVQEFNVRAAQAAVAEARKS